MPSHCTAITAPACTCTSPSPKMAKNTCGLEGYSALSYALSSLAASFKQRQVAERRQQPVYKQLQAPGTCVLKHRSCSPLGPQTGSAHPYSLRFQPKARRSKARISLTGPTLYLASSRTVIGGLGWYSEKTHPGDCDKNLYNLPPDRGCQISQVCGA